jgi:acyl-CoA reductase-like NAD-dependent aldehyde dehydrogenase
MCGTYLQPILMELGGKCPVIVCGDANLAKAAKATAFGAFLHHGQICMTTERIIVVKDVAEEFTALLGEEVDAWVALAGSAATKQFADKAHNLVEEALTEGAELVMGDNSYLGTHKTSLRPTIIKEVNPKSKLYDTESFGPSATLIFVNDGEGVLAVAHSSEYGLTGAIWTNDTMRGIALSKRVENNVISVNDGTVLTDIPPTVFSGATNNKGSGWGLVNGTAGIREFLNTKAVIVKS